MRWLPYIIAILCVFIMASEIRAQDKQQRWRVTYLNDYNQEIRGTKQSLGGCIAAIALIYTKEQRDYYCTADSVHTTETSTHLTHQGGNAKK